MRSYGNVSIYTTLYCHTSSDDQYSQEKQKRVNISENATESYSYLSSQIVPLSHESCQGVDAYSRIRYPWIVKNI